MLGSGLSRLTQEFRLYRRINWQRQKWQERPEPLRDCQIVFGCLDGFKGRQELEVACRRYMMHYIDVGMDVYGLKRPLITGQVIQSSPGGPCMWCMRFLDDDALAREAKLYGDAGTRPQVVWPNGVLASTAVGLAVDLVTNWTDTNRNYAYFVYDGNEGVIKESRTTSKVIFPECPHFPSKAVGDPQFETL